MSVIEEFENEFKNFAESKFVIACCNGTSALHTALVALEIGEGDKVITTPFSFIASSNCILQVGATPIFADINPETYCLDANKVEEILEKRRELGLTTEAILCVHLFGNACNLDKLRFLCEHYDLKLIEDCAQALGRKYDRIHVGNFGDFGCFSFYSSKNLPLFEGGALITNDKKLANKARMIINHGREIGTTHDHAILGFNYRMHPISAMIGIMYLRRHKQAILSELGSYGIEDGYYPYVIYKLPLYKKLGIKGDCPIAESVAEEVRRLANSEEN